MKIGVINAGNIGGRLAKAWVRAGHQVMVSKDGDAAKLQPLLAELGDRPVAGTLEEAAQFSNVLLFSAYWPRFDAVLARLGSLDGKILIDTGNPLKVSEGFEHYHDLEFMRDNSTSEELQKRQPNAKVVKAFSTLGAELLDVEAWQGSALLPSIFYCGGDSQAKQIVAQLITDVGFPAVDAGPLSSARILEAMGILQHNIMAAQTGGDSRYLKIAPTILHAP